MMEGTQPWPFINIPALLIIARAARCGATHGGDEHRAAQDDPEALHQGASARTPLDLARARAAARRASPRRRAATACWRSTTQSSEIDDAFTKKGLQLVVDGTDPDLVRDDPRRRDRRHGAAPRAGARSRSRRPAASRRRIGIIGTVMGLVHVLENLTDAGRRSAPRSPARSSRRCYGVGAANVDLPADRATRLKELSEAEVELPRDDARGRSSPSRPATTRACRREARDLRAARRARRGARSRRRRRGRGRPPPRPRRRPP